MMVVCNCALLVAGADRWMAVSSAKGNGVMAINVWETQVGAQVLQEKEEFDCCTQVLEKRTWKLVLVVDIFNILILNTKYYNCLYSLRASKVYVHFFGHCVCEQAFSRSK
jgi:hypothetical protein